jgi:NIPSNAP
VSAQPRSPASDESSVVELRRYRLHPGAREKLIDLFEREFVEAQEVVGMTVIGQFRDLDDLDSFVWLRGFRDMPSRAEALGAFYGGPRFVRKFIPCSGSGRAVVVP